LNSLPLPFYIVPNDKVFLFGMFGTKRFCPSVKAIQWNLLHCTV